MRIVRAGFPVVMLACALLVVATLLTGWALT